MPKTQIRVKLIAAPDDPFFIKGKVSGALEASGYTILSEQFLDEVQGLTYYNLLDKVCDYIVVD